MRRQRPRPGDRWHLDEVFIRIQGELHYLWRAVDQNGVVLDILVQRKRDAKAAKRFFKRLLRELPYVPRVIVTDKLKSYGVAKREVLPNVEHRQSRYLNNRVENSHRPTRRRERQMQRFKSTTPGPSVPIRTILHLRPFSATAASHACQGLSGGPGNGVHGLAAGDVRANGNLIAQYVRNPVSPCQTQINVTMPPCQIDTLGHLWLALHRRRDFF